MRQKSFLIEKHKEEQRATKQQKGGLFVKTLVELHKTAR
jgi:hypothetical protein